MMQQLTEGMIKRHLDGTFTRLLPGGGVKIAKVPRNHVPDHVTPRMPACIQRRGQKKVLFTADEDAEIIRLTKWGKTKTHIAILLGRKTGTIKYRQDWLRQRGRL